MTHYERLKLIEKEIVYRYENGTSSKKLAKEYKVNQPVISKILKENNIILNKYYPKPGYGRKYTINEHYMDIIDCEEKAYILGLFYADGCNYTPDNMIILRLQCCDRHIIEEISKCFGSTYPIRLTNKKRCNPVWQNQYSIGWKSEHLSKQLTNLGCVHNKTYKLKFPEEGIIPKELMRHFIRGYFDGDGCFSCSETKWKHKKYTLHLVSTIDFCQGVIKFLADEGVCKACYIDSKRYTEYGNNVTGCLKYYRREEMFQLLHYMYDNSNIFLHRKKQFFIQECKWRDENYNIPLQKLQKRKDEIYSLYKAGINMNKLANAYDVSWSSIKRWIQECEN